MLIGGNLCAIYGKSVWLCNCSVNLKLFKKIKLKNNNNGRKQALRRGGHTVPLRNSIAGSSYSKASGQGVSPTWSEFPVFIFKVIIQVAFILT